MAINLSEEEKIANSLIDSFLKLPFVMDRYEEAPECAIVAVDEHIEQLMKEVTFYKKVKAIIKSKKG